jgi:putative ABC transport system permease protein
VQANGDPTALIAPARQALNALSPNLALSKVRLLSEYTTKALAPARFIALLASIFGALALLLAMIGIYGVVSYSVSQRTREIGVRLALGAQSRDVLALVVKHGMRPALVGVAIGLLGAFTLTRFIAGLLFGVRALDPMTFSLAALLLLLVALLACWIPARRATQVDPMLTLRCE